MHFCSVESSDLSYIIPKKATEKIALKAKVTELARSIGANPSLIEIWRNQYALGLDTEQKKLVYIREGEKFNFYSFCLEDFKKVNLVKKFKDSGSSLQKTKHIDYVALELVPKFAENQAASMEIYDGEQFSDLLGETIVAEKWLELLNKQLN